MACDAVSHENRKDGEMATELRTYIVRPKGGEGRVRLVKASGASAALKHVVEDTLSVDYASQDDLVALFREQPDTPLEIAGAQPEAPPPAAT